MKRNYPISREEGFKHSRWPYGQFAAISLGAAFGLQSGRTNGMLIGILSAGIIAFITSSW